MSVAGPALGVSMVGVGVGLGVKVIEGVTWGVVPVLFITKNAIPAKPDPRTAEISTAISVRQPWDGRSSARAGATESVSMVSSGKYPLLLMC